MSTGISYTLLNQKCLSHGFAYTIGTLVTDWTHYKAMTDTFISNGFGTHDCEYLVVDNTGADQTSAYEGLNRILNQARGQYVILCHQDIRLLEDDRSVLDLRLSELEILNPNWAVVGNAGGGEPGRLILRISDPHGKDQRQGSFPSLVNSVDENFIVIKRSSRLGFSRNLGGFHFYGADICLLADIIGYSSYVIDFHLLHLSPGNTKSTEYAVGYSQFEQKWSTALRPRWVQMTSKLIGLSGNPIQQAWRRWKAPKLAKRKRRQYKL